MRVRGDGVDRHGRPPGEAIATSSRYALGTPEAKGMAWRDLLAVKAALEA